MSPNKRAAKGKKSRQFVIDNYSPSVIGKKLESIIDDIPFCDWDFDFSEKKRNPNYIPPYIENDSLWLVDIYKNILNMDVHPKTDKGHSHWMSKLSDGTDREDILKYFHKIASKENEEITSKKKIEDILGDEGRNNRIAIVLPGDAGDVLMLNGLMSNLKSIYPKKNIYVFTKPHFFSMIEDNPAVYKTLPYDTTYDNLHFLEGSGDHKGYFEIAYLPHIGTQRIINYTHNGKDKTQIELYEN